MKVDCDKVKMYIIDSNETKETKQWGIAYRRIKEIKWNHKNKTKTKLNPKVSKKEEKGNKE